MKYTAKAKLKYVLVVDKDKSTPFNTIYKIYDAKDSYSGVYYAEGGLTDAEYVSKRNSLVVGSDGKIVSDKFNGVWLKETAKPLGSIEKTEAMDLNTASDWENYLKGESGGAEVELSPTRISKGHYGWKAKTETKAEINGYDWEIVTMKRSDGKLSSTVQGGKTKKYEGYSTFEVAIFQDPRATLVVTAPKVVNEKRVREQHEQAVAEFKKMVAEARLPKKQYAKGGGVGDENDKTMREKIAEMNIALNTKNGQVYVGGIKPKNRLFKDENGYYVVEGYGKFMGKKYPLKKHFSMSENEVLDAYMQDKYAKGGEMANYNGAGIFAGGGKVNDSFDYEKFVNSSNGEALAMLRKHYGNEIMGEDFHGFGDDELMDKAENKFLDLVNKGLLLQNADGETLTPRPFKTNIVIDLQSNETKEFDDKTEAFKYAKKAMREGWDVVDINAYIEDDSDPTSWSNESNRYVATRKENLMRAFRNFRGNFKPETPKSSLYGYGIFAGGGGTEIIPPKGELRNADNHLLKYEKNGSQYEFYVYKPVSKLVSGYEQTKHICVNADCALKMNYKQFINYLYGEGYIDDRKNAKGGYMADGGRLENISPVIKPKIEAIEKILPKALGEGGYMTIVFAFQTKDGYAFNMESKSDYPVNRATPKLKRIGVVVERTGEKGKRLITIPKGVFDQMTTIYMVGGEFADGGIQNHPLNIQIHTKIAEELGREMAARFIINDYSRDSGIGAVRLIEMAIQRGFISLDEINSDIINSAEEQADESAEMEEIGSSDTNILIHSMLRNAGIEMDYEGNRMVRKYSTPEEANIKSSTHKNEK